VWIVLIVRVYYISIKSNVYYDEIAKRNALKTELLPPLRGIIYDRNDNPLAVNQLGFAIGIRPHLSSKKLLGELESEIEYLTSLIPSLEADAIRKKYLKNDSPYEHNIVQVVDFLPYDDVVASFSMINLRQNSSIYPTSRRFYPYEQVASHIIGYVGRTNLDDYSDPIAKLTGSIGRTGVERYYNDILKGERGVRVSKVNALNQEIEMIERKSPVSRDMHLSIDIELQKHISSLFANKSGTAIVVDLSDGSILAAVSYPEYNLNNFVAGISHEEWRRLSTDFNHPFTNKLVNGLYPPGSVVKMGMGLAFLDSGEVTPATTFDCQGVITVGTIGGRQFRCWKHDGHGVTNLRKAIRESCDVYFYDGAQRVGIDKMAPVLERFGFGSKTGVDLPHEFVGIVPSREWKMNKYGEPWFHGDTVITSIGQGSFLATTMQVARYTAMLATGRDIIPHFLVSASGEKQDFTSNVTIFNPIEKRNLPLIREAMYEVCNAPMGTASRNVKTPVKLACKTGTAQVVSLPQEEKARMKEHELEYYQRSHGWLTSFGPYKNPKYAVTVLVEHAGGAAPSTALASDIYNKLYEMGYITSYE
jgi:penicillin-binding protein 2